MLEGFRLFDICTLNNLVPSLACPNCHECCLHLDEDHNKLKGLASFISVRCDSCEDFNFESLSSKCFRSGTGSGPGQNPLEVNCRAVYACRTIGAGYAALENVCGMISLPRPMIKKNFDKISLVLGSSAQAVAQSSKSATAGELRKPSMKDLPADIGVSVDGTWQKRGYVSLNCVVAVISMDSGKVIDIEVMSRYCLACQKKKDSVTDDEFHKSFCSANHEGTSPMMEVEGIVRIVWRSIEK